jgi:type II secretory pathway predicted ATPase ExeA
MDVARHWGLRQLPFEPTLAREFYFPSGSHAEALARLQFLALDGSFGFGVLSGEIGSGKSYTAYTFTRGLDARQFAAVFVENSHLGFACIMDQINCALGDRHPDGAPRSRYELLLEFRFLLHSRVLCRGAHLILVLDEAQDLSDEDLTEFRCLTNMTNASRRALTVVLVGQPELRALVRGMPAVDTRVGLRYHLGLLTPAEVAAYVTHRCRAAGHATGRLFTDEALAELADASGGMPREINRVAKLAMLNAAARGARIVTGLEVGSVAHDAVA